GTEWMAFRKGVSFEQDEFLQPLQKIALAAILPPPQRIRGDRIGAGRAAEAEIDTAGKQRLQHFEPLGHHERSVIWQNDAAGAYPDAFGRYRDLPDHDVGRGTRDRGQIVVFG